MYQKQITGACDLYYQEKTYQKWLFYNYLSKDKDDKVKTFMLVNDNIEIVEVEYLYLYIFFPTHDD